MRSGAVEVRSGFERVPIATTTISHGISNSEPGIGSGRARPDASGSPSSIRTQRERANPAGLVAEDLDRGDQEVEPDPLLLGVVDLLGPGRELVAPPAIDDHRLARAEPPGRPDRVHRDVPTADDGDPLPVQDGRLGAGFQAPIRLTRVRYSLAE